MMVCSFRFGAGAAVEERATAAEERATVVAAACIAAEAECTAAEAECMAAATRTGEEAAGCTGPAEPTPGEGTFMEETSTAM
jgi:hypothetical protein